MKRIAAAALVLLIATPLAAQPAVPASQGEITLSFAPVVRETTPAVVNIYASRVVETRISPFANDPFFRDFFRDFGQVTPQVQNSLGSGVVLSPDGIVVSNYHVVGEATQIRVVLSDRREFDADVLLADEEVDLAILKLRDAADLPALELRDSDGVEVGELVLAIGNPFGVGQTVSSGIVSGLARSNLSIGGGRGYFIQTDAAINPGNSGGALVDMAGRLVGVNTAILTRSGGSNGIGFAIPANLVQRFVEQARAGETTFQRPWAGVSGQALDAGLAETFGLSRPEGIIVSELHPASPLRAAGIVPGDIILRLDGGVVNTPQEMIFRMAVKGAGQQVVLDYLRDGAVREARVDLIAAPEDPARAALTISAEGPLRGLSAANVNPAVIAELGLANSAEGVVVTDVQDIARRTGLVPGDLLLRVNDTPLASTADLQRAAAAGGRNWVIEYQRAGQRGVLRFRL